MKKLLFLLLLLPAAAFGQQVNATLDITWTNPTTTEPPASLPLTGAQALTETQLVISTSPISSTYSGVPTVVVTPTPTTARHTMQVANGGTIYVRVRACNKPGTVTECSAWSNESTRLVSVSTKPNVPTNVTITLTIG